MSDIVERLVARDRARQALPARITNSEALDRVAAVLAAGPENTTARRLPSAERSRTGAAEHDRSLTTAA